METVLETARVYLPFVRNSFLSLLAYRLRYYTGIVTYLMFVSVNYFVWQAVFAGHGAGAKINGFTFEEMITYIVVGWISRSLYYSDIDDDIDELVRSGQIASYLLRPVNFQGMMLSQALGQALFRALLFSLPIGIVVLLVFPVQPPPNAASAALFALSTSAAFLIYAQINFCVGLLAFWFGSIDGIMRAKYFLVQLLSGLLMPLTFFPAWLSSMLQVLPFKAIAYQPLRLYLGKEDSPAWSLLTQVVWILVLFALGSFMWRRASAKLTLQGG